MLLVTELQAGPGAGVGQGNGCSPLFLCAAGKQGWKMPMGAPPSLFPAPAAGPQMCWVLP